MSRFNPQQLLSSLTTIEPPTTYWVAYSGGCDSLVLLHALVQIREHLNAPIRAIHVHHGLQKEADQWAAMCTDICHELAVPLQILTLNLVPIKGKSLEAHARDLRYKAMFDCLESSDILLTGHHQDDQAETVLLQLMRGAGITGLSAMPMMKSVGDYWHLRPFLTKSRQSLQDYAEQNNLIWIEDPSNLHTSFDRNFLRHNIIPRLKQRWPSMDVTVSRSASHCAQTMGLIKQQAVDDLISVQIQVNQIDLSQVSDWNTARLQAMLRQWFLQQQVKLPDTKHLQRMIDEVIFSSVDAMPLVHWGDFEVRRYRQVMYLMKRIKGFEFTQLTLSHTSVDFIYNDQSWFLDDEAEGIDRDFWYSAKIEIKQRKGGERFQKQFKGRHVQLKKWFQEMGIVPWQRDQLPLIYCNNQLVFVGEYLVAEYLRCHDGISFHCSDR